MGNIGLVSSFVKPQFDISKRHIELLTGAPNAEIAFRLIHDTRDNDGRNLIGTLADVWPEIERGQADGYGVFIVVNEGGQRAANISRVRALFVDADDVPLPSAWHCEPTFLVKRGPGRWHAYWLVCDIGVDDFKDAQLRLAARYGTDPKVHDLPRVMRLAGSIHLKDTNSPQPVMLTECNAWSMYEPYRGADVLDGLPTVATRKQDKRDTIEGFQFDLPDNIRRAEKHLGRTPPPGEGERNRKTFINACIVKDLGCSPEKTLELMLGWAPISDDFTEEEVSTCVWSAFQNGQNAPGTDAVQPSSEAFKNLVANAPPTASPSVSKPSPFRVTRESEMDHEAPIEWLIPEFLQRRSTAMIAAKTQSYKSFIALDVALAVASGMPTFGAKPTRTGPVVYAALEGLRGIKGDRRKAWRQARGIAADRELPFFTMKAPLVGSSEEKHAFLDELLRQFPDGVELVVLETVAKMMLGMDENSSKDASIFCAFCDELVEHLGCAVVAVHHQSDKLGAADYRGSSAFMAGVDQFFEVKADRSSTTVMVWQTKVKDGEPREAPWHFRGVQSGPSMAFELLSETQHREVVKGRDLCSPRAVGTALAEIGARGVDRGVSTNVLASALAPVQDGEGVDDHAKRILALETRLRRRQREGVLDGYFDRNERGQSSWFIP